VASTTIYPVIRTLTRQHERHLSLNASGSVVARTTSNELARYAKLERSSIMIEQITRDLHDEPVARLWGARASVVDCERSRPFPASIGRGHGTVSLNQVQ